MSKGTLLKRARKGILFNSDMVQAILDNRKKSTRRVITNLEHIEDIELTKTLYAPLRLGISFI